MLTIVTVLHDLHYILAFRYWNAACYSSFKIRIVLNAKYFFICFFTIGQLTVVTSHWPCTYVPPLLPHFYKLHSRFFGCGFQEITDDPIKKEPVSEGYYNFFFILKVILSQVGFFADTTKILSRKLKTIQMRTRLRVTGIVILKNR